MRDVRVRSYVIGASNGLFRHQTQLDVIVNDHDDELLIPSAELRQELQLTTADLRFAQLFEEGQTGEDGETRLSLSPSDDACHCRCTRRSRDPSSVHGLSSVPIGRGEQSQ